MEEPTTNGQLLESSPLLDWLPNETLFNLASRIHRLWGHTQARRTSERLFGSPKAGTHHDFPYGIRNFEALTGQYLGTAQQIARERTLLKFYRSFISIVNCEAVAETMCGSSVAHLKFRLGLLTSRFRANHPLKACPACMNDDRAQYGWAYWHIEHQFPGVWWCQVHGLPLRESLFKSTGVERFLWHLPVLKNLRQWPSDDFVYPKATAAAIESLACTTKDLVDKGAEMPFDTDRFCVIYRAELERRGWLGGQRLRFSEMAPDFVAYSARLRDLPELSALPATVEEAVAQLGRMFRRQRSGTHPLRHIVLIDWLFGGARDFVDCYQRLNTLPEVNFFLDAVPQLSADAELAADPRVEQLLSLLRDQGASVSGAAKKIGVDVRTAMAWAAKAGLTVSRRPKVLKETKRKALIEMLQAGIDKAEIAQKLGVSISTVTRIIRTEPGLQRQWHAARFDSAQENARTTWKSLITEYPYLGVKLLRELEPAIYAWLYRNDRDWLKAHSPHTNESPGNGVNNRIRWDERDATLSTEVQRTALTLTTANPRARIHLWQLYQQIPELKAKLRVLHRLPLTKRAIERALNRPAPNPNSDSELF